MFSYAWAIFVRHAGPGGKFICGERLKNQLRATAGSDVTVHDRRPDRQGVIWSSR